MTQNNITVRFENSEISFNEEDRIFGIMYRAYHDAADSAIAPYFEAVATDLDALSRWKLESYRNALNARGADADPVGAALEISKSIVGYRSTKDYQSPLTYIGIIQMLFEVGGHGFLKNIFETDEYGLTPIDVTEHIKRFERKYYADKYKNYHGSKTFREFLQDKEWTEEDYKRLNLYLYSFYTGKSFNDEFEELKNFFGDIDAVFENSRVNHSELLRFAKKEVNWRIQYLNNPNSFRTIRPLCEFVILELIACTSEGLELNLNPKYSNMDDYRNFLEKLDLLETNKASDPKRTTLETLIAFPFEIPLYKYILRYYGDVGGTVTSLAEFFNIDIEKNILKFKKELLTEFLNSLPQINMNSEAEIKNLLDIIKEQKQFLEYYPETEKENQLQKRLNEIDIFERTVRGRLYETREEAQNVRNDYDLLDNMIRSIDFHQYDLLNPNDISRIKSYLLAANFSSKAFRTSPDHVLMELEPLLNHNIQLQTWRKQLLESREPWAEVEKIIRSSEITQEYKDRFRYWNFNGLKKYYPTLIKYERPVLFFQTSLFGWSSYFVLTNKRGLYITKNTQNSVSLDESTVISYMNNQLSISSSNENRRLLIPMKYPENMIPYFLDILAGLAETLSKCDERLFEVPADFYPDTNSMPSAQEMISEQLKGIFYGKISPVIKKAQNAMDGSASAFSGTTPQPPNGMVSRVQPAALPPNSQPAKICTRCGAAIDPVANFCTNCGNSSYSPYAVNIPQPIAITAAEIQPAALPPNSQNAKFCTQCGAAIDPAANFCTNCGNRLN